MADFKKCDECGKLVERRGGSSFDNPKGWSSIYWTQKPGSKQEMEAVLYGAEGLSCHADLCQACTEKLLPSMPRAVKGQLSWWKKLVARRTSGKV